MPLVVVGELLDRGQQLATLVSVRTAPASALPRCAHIRRFGRASGRRDDQRWKATLLPAGTVASLTTTLEHLSNQTSVLNGGRRHSRSASISSAHLVSTPPETAVPHQLARSDPLTARICRRMDATPTTRPSPSPGATRRCTVEVAIMYSLAVGSLRGLDVEILRVGRRRGVGWLRWRSPEVRRSRGRADADQSARADAGRAVSPRGEPGGDPGRVGRDRLSRWTRMESRRRSRRAQAAGRDDHTHELSLRQRDQDGDRRARAAARRTGPAGPRRPDHSLVPRVARRPRSDRTRSAGPHRGNEGFPPTRL